MDKRKIIKITIISIVGILLLFLIVNGILYFNARGKKKKYDTIISSYIEDLKLWAHDNINNNSVITKVTLNDLVTNGYSKALKNPYTKNYFGDETAFCIIKDNDEYLYLYDDGTNCGDTILETIDDPEESYNDYLYSQTIKASFMSLEGLEYYIKSSKDATSNINLNFACGKESIGNCTEIKSTKKIKANVWYRISGNIEILYEDHSLEEGYLTTFVTDNVNYKETKKIITSKIDRKAPIVVLDSPITSTNSISIKVDSILDNDTDIASSVCRYGTKEDEYTTISMSNTKGKLSKCSINFILKDKIYYYQVCATDKVGNVGCAKGSSLIQSIKNPKVTYTSDGITIDYNNKSKGLSFYIRSNIELELSDVTKNYCGKESLPKDCISNKVTKLLPNVWYEVSSKDIDVKYNKEGIIYMLVMDDDRIVSTSANVKK